MNNKYIVKFEAGPMEQAFKFHTDDVTSLELLKLKINEDFIEKVGFIVEVDRTCLNLLV